jgi:hypothetical protein
MVDLLALHEFMVLYQLKHWHIAKLPVEILSQIAKQMGHDEYFSKQILSSAAKEAKEQLKKWSTPPADMRCKTELVYDLGDQYACIPRAIEVALGLLNEMQELAPRSLLKSYFSTENERRRKCHAKILKLADTLILRNGSSAIAYYMKGISIASGRPYLEMAKALDDAHNLSLSHSQRKHLDALLEGQYVPVPD